MFGKNQLRKIFQAAALTLGIAGTGLGVAAMGVGVATEIKYADQADQCSKNIMAGIGCNLAEARASSIKNDALSLERDALFLMASGGILAAKRKKFFTDENSPPKMT